MVREFDCAVCGGHFITATLESEVMQEFLKSGIETDGDSELLSVCDVCYDAVMRRAREQGVLEDSEWPPHDGDDPSDL